MFKKRRFSAVILSGGSSSRMGGISKQMTQICGVPVVVRSILAFEKCPECSEIVIVSKEDEMSVYPGLIEKYGIKKVTAVVKGGDTRQQSAMNGLKKTDHEADYVAFHDAARCLVSPEDISRVFAGAYRNKCATACCAATDTIKISGRDGKTAVEGQIPREKLYAMQTPQIFLRDLYEAAAYMAQREGFTATDDCALLEHAGFGCTLVPTDRFNIKITTPDDLIIAEALIKHREEK